jgi:trans-aconitate methyltransferase
MQDRWANGAAYEQYVGRWSRPVAAMFVRWLDVPAGKHWLDVGCGTGALTETLLDKADPASVLGVDPSEGFLGLAREQVTDPRAEFRTGDARALPDGPFDAAVSGLSLNFVPSAQEAVAELHRVVAPGGVAAAYVWDYAEGMEMMRYFWDVAMSVDSDAADKNESTRFPLCRPEALTELWSGFDDVEVRPIEVPTVFADFDDYWSPFLGGQGAAPSYVATLSDADRDAIRDLVRFQLPAGPDGRIVLSATAWAVRGRAKV